MSRFHRYISAIVFAILMTVLIVLSPGTANAQTDLDYTLTPIYGSTNISSGFLPDPYTAAVYGGGSVNIDNALNGPGCVGYTTNAPTFRVRLSGSSSFIRFFFVGNRDTTMVVNDPSGNWYCNDDSFSTTQPSINFNYPQNGTYDIWVGTYSSGASAPGAIYVTELSFNTPAGYAYTGGGSGSGGGSSSGTSLDHTRYANYGTVDLRSGFRNTPWAYNVTSGGSVMVSDYLSGCAGYVTVAPDIQLNWTEYSAFLRIFVVSNSDTTLIVRNPNGNWYCDDDYDAGGLDPVVQFNPGLAGTYDIWIGSYRSGNPASAVLFITESTTLDPLDY